MILWIPWGCDNYHFINKKTDIKGNIDGNYDDNEGGYNRQLG